MDAPLVLALSDAAVAPVSLVGGKAAGFRTLAAAGLAFPQGIVVTAEAHRRARADGWRAGSPLPPDLAELVRASVAELPDEPLVVRSSAVAEDGNGASFAGQFETIVAVAPAEVGEALVTCWESAEDGRARAYRLGDGAEHTMAVIVQELVPAESAGVVVTADPLTGDEGVLLVNASWGLGEAVVSGLVTPDEFRLARVDGAVLGVALGDKEVAIVLGPEGPLEQQVPPERRDAPALGPAELDAVRRGALSAEAVLGCPADLEFAIHRGRPVWLQCRPLTALPAKEAR